MKKTKQIFSTILAVLLSGSMYFSASTTVLAQADEPEDIRYGKVEGNQDISTCDVYTDETITYTSKEDTYQETTNGAPFYQSPSSLTNNCGSVAGATVVGFYDKYYEDLIPNYVSYYPATGIYKRSDSTYVPALISELYTLMRTNEDDVGVSESDCLDGLETYVEGKGRSISYSSLKSWGTFNRSAYTTALANNKPALLFCNTNVKLTKIVPNANGTSDIIVVETLPSNHIVVAYGLMTIKYYNGSNNFRTDYYVRVATGLSSMSVYHINIGSINWLNSAYTVNIS